MLDVKVEKDGEIEYLPLPEFVGLGYAELGFTAAEERNWRVYEAIVKRENYYQYNDPTAFGNPDYAYLNGVLWGLIVGYGLNIYETKQEICVYTQGHKLIMRVQRPQKTPWYKEKKKEAIETWNKIF